jgi:isochorismate synthase
VPATPPHPPHPPQPPQPLPFCADETAYRSLVSAGIALLQSGGARKVVPSRAAVQPLPVDFDTWTAFERLCAAYPHAFVSLVSIPSHGRWLGATPELLVEVEGGHTFRTVALAGTQPALPDAPDGAARWSHKELEEQAHVTRYVIDCFKKLRLREYHEIGPRTVRAGHLWHLRSDFTVDLTHVPFPALGTDMLRLLHPTSAVAGMPKDTALAWLRTHEGYDRTYYSGFLGPVNLPDAGNSALYVNLRCMQLREKEALLFAGGGLTPESDPTSEWLETEQKLRVIADVVL